DQWPLPLDDLRAGRHRWYGYAVYPWYRAGWISHYMQPDGTSVATEDWHKVIPRRIRDHHDRPIVGDHFSWKSGDSEGTSFHEAPETNAVYDHDRFSGNFYYGDGSAAYKEKGFVSWLDSGFGFEYQWVVR
ncbi:MAG: hypothetical protein ACOC2T_03895, partial [Planctomycetota bacterium]